MSGTFTDPNLSDALIKLHNKLKGNQEINIKVEAISPIIAINITEYMQESGVEFSKKCVNRQFDLARLLSIKFDVVDDEVDGMLFELEKNG